MANAAALELRGATSTPKGRVRLALRLTIFNGRTRRNCWLAPAREAQRLASS